MPMIQGCDLFVFKRCIKMNVSLLSWQHKMDGRTEVKPWLCMEIKISNGLHENNKTSTQGVLIDYHRWRECFNQEILVHSYLLIVFL